MTLWKHESSHAAYFASYFKSADDLAKQWAPKCIIEPCDSYRRQYVLLMISAYRLKRTYQDAFLHWKDYPENEEEKWKTLYESLLAEYNSRQKEAEKARNDLDKCQATH